MKNKVEILRVICYTAEDLKNITNLADEFTPKEIEFMVEFKKIYELGLTQLKKFIDKLDEEGKDLDTYSILYYVNVLNHGPLGSYVREFSKDKKYFGNTPDSIATLGNKTKSSQNNTIYEDVEYQLGASVDTYNKLPGFSQTTLEKAIKETESVFRSSLKSSTENDNTLPIIDKAPQKRYDEESKGDWVKRANGSFLVKDRYFYLAIDDKSEDIFEKVKKTLGDEDYRIYKDKKQFSPFDSDKNESTAINNKIEKNFYDGELKEKITLDLMGEEFDSEDNRKATLKITTDSKDKEYNLNSNEGQLGG